MSIPKLYTVLPEKEGNLDTKLLTDHSSKVITGAGGEKFVVLSYFSETLKYSKKSDFLLNKYVLFIVDANEAAEYSTSWKYELLDGETSIIDRFTVKTSPTSGEFEFLLGLKDTEYPETSDWEFTLKIECTVFKNSEAIEFIHLKQNILPIESELLSENGASFEDETGRTNSSVTLGNEPTTHFLRGHLSQYLVAKKEYEKKEAKKKGKETIGTKGDFTHQTSAIVYNKVLRANRELFEVADHFHDAFNRTFANSSLEESFTEDGTFNEDAFEKIGICSLNLHHVLPEVLGSEAKRVDTPENLVNNLRHAYDNNYDDFVLAYHRCTFPKSAIHLSVDIFDKLFNSFKKETGSSNHIYNTTETAKRTSEEQNAKIEEWSKLTYTELRETGNDEFMKNLIAEYYAGYYLSVSSHAFSSSPSKAILRIDWSQFIQKLLNPTAIAVPFTQVKIQVRDLRSGKPIANTLVKRVEFQVFKSTPDYDKDVKFSYEITSAKATTASAMIAPTDSRNMRVQKICKLMGYFTGTVSDVYNSRMRTGMYKYLTSTDRALSISPIEAPKSASEADINLKKDAWIDYIIEDFTSNCLTDGNGILNCRVPDELLENHKLNINVGFAHFAVVRERFEGEEESSLANPPIKRPTPITETGPTKFMAHWVGDSSSENPNEQNLSWEDHIKSDKNFGWKITGESGMPEGTEKSTTNQLRVAIPLEVKTIDSKDYDFLKMLYPGYQDLGYSTKHFSTFFEDTDIHFVLYGMQWCQPVWDEFDYTEMINGKPKNTFVQDANVLHPHMHLVTNPAAMKGDFGKYEKGKKPYYGGTLEKFGGKGYGKRERNLPLGLVSTWRGGDGHEGYDIHAKIGANVFALHCGTFNFEYTNATGGYGGTVSWKNYKNVLKDEHTYVQYLHLDETGGLRPNYSFVIAGTLVSKGGRTGNINDKVHCTNPSHVHINCGRKKELDPDRERNLDRVYEPPLRKTLDTYYPDNAKVIPNNSSPLLLPCRGEMRVGSNWTAINKCKLDHNVFVQWCWAAGELECPHINKTMNKSNENLFQLFIQLRYLNQTPTTVEKRIIHERYKVISEVSDKKEDEGYFVDKVVFAKVDKNQKYFYPGRLRDSHDDADSCEKEFGKITKVEGSTIPKDTVLTLKSTAHLENDNHALHWVQYEIGGSKKTTWIEKGYIGTDNKLTETLKNVPSTDNKPSKMRMAIYCFRKEHDLLKTDNYYQNFETDDEFWEELNAQCGF